jgi:hypothetical protein
MKRFLAKYKTSSLRTCHGSQYVGSMRHINDELINDTHTYNGEGVEEASEEVI